MPLIGMDSEWRPNIKPFSVERIATLQLSSDTDAFIIDLIALGASPLLDAKLTEIFNDDRSLCLGFSFGSDLSMFKNTLPQMQFHKRIAHLLDIQ